MALEIELKLRLSPVDHQRLLRHPIWERAESRVDTRLQNIYYDTPDLALQCNGIALRRRRNRKCWLQTVKCAGAASGGLSQRPEWEGDWRGDFDFSDIDDTALKKRLERARTRLMPIFETNFRRTEWKLLEGDSELLVAFDRGAIVAREIREPISEIELELVSGNTMHLFSFAQQLAAAFALSPLPWSKAERGYRIFLGTPRTPRLAMPIELDAACSSRVMFARIVGACLDHLHGNYEGAAFGKDPAYIHQMRVALRRLRAALRLFRPQLPPGIEQATKSNLATLMKMLAEARDFDVLMQEIVAPVAHALPGEPRIEALAATAEVARQAARTHTLEHLHSPQYGDAVLRVTAALHGLAVDHSDVNMRSFIPRRLRKLHRIVVLRAQRADAANPASLHRLRVGIKRLRYALEFFSPLLKARPTDALLKQLVELQDQLGQLNDLVNAGPLLMACTDDRPDLREGVSLIGGWHMQRYAQLQCDISPALARLQLTQVPKVH